MRTVREYAILYVGGRVIAGSTIAGGNVALTTNQHTLSGPEHSGQLPADRVSYDNVVSGLTADDVQAALDELAADSGAVVPVDHGNMGAAETIDLAAGTWHRGTLDANCTITVQGWSVDQAVVAIAKVTQNGTGGWDITWDGDVVFAGDDQPDQTASSVTWFLLWSDEGDSVIYGAKIGTADTGVSAEDLIAMGVIGPILIADDHSTPLVFADLIQTEEGDDLLYADIGA
jgi:hypothetical protein